MNPECVSGGAGMHLDQVGTDLKVNSYTTNVGISSVSIGSSSMSLTSRDNSVESAVGGLRSQSAEGSRMHNNCVVKDGPLKNSKSTFTR